MPTSEPCERLVRLGRLQCAPFSLIFPHVNYRHLFHAGNFADVHKHVVLLAVLDYLLQKPKPLFYLDTHAGRGEYDLHAPEAQRGSEWQHGIGRLFDAAVTSPAVQRYVELIRAHQGGAKRVRTYPGSPLLANAVLRDGDRRVFVEKHPEECLALRKVFRQLAAPNTSVMEDDAYHALRAYLPPKEKRGVVLIDAAFEEPDEFQQLSAALSFVAERWPTGVYCLWYPLKAGGLVNPFYAALKRLNLPKLLLLELWVRPLDAPLGLNGSGMLIMNPPWQLDTHMRAAGQELLSLLAEDGRGGMRVEWL